jgi:DNA-binding protein
MYRLRDQQASAPALVFFAHGEAINKVVTVIEIIKRKVKVHQVNKIGTLQQIEVWESKLEGVDSYVHSRCFFFIFYFLFFFGGLRIDKGCPFGLLIESGPIL